MSNYYEYDSPFVLTLSGSEITDAVRVAAVQGDRLVPPSGVGVWEGTTNLVTNNGFETDTSGWSAGAGATIARDTSRAAFGAASLLATTIASTNQALASSTLAVSALAYTYSAWVFVPSAWTSGTVGLRVSFPASVSGGEITDAVRAANVEGDGLPAPDSSFGIWEPTTNLLQNGGFGATIVGVNRQTGETVTRDTGTFKFGTASVKVVTQGSVPFEGVWIGAS